MQGTNIRNRFKPGDMVRVLHLGKSGHVRIPYYVRGKCGEIVHYCGSYLNPEDLSIGLTNGPVKDYIELSLARQSYGPMIANHWVIP